MALPRLGVQEGCGRADFIFDFETVAVSSPQVAKPVAVRYAFFNNPEGCNFSNGSGLPAMPFRTDAKR